LLGSLLAFTFFGAAERFEGRRQPIIEEANDIGRAYLRLDLLPTDAEPEINELFRVMWILVSPSTRTRVTDHCLESVSPSPRSCKAKI